MDRHWRHTRNPRRMDSFRDENICSRFINRSCSRGSSCFYRHEWPVLPSPQVCRYFQKGGCWFGPFCRYLHILQPEVPSGRRSSVPTVSSSSFVDSPPNRRGSVPAPLQAEGVSRQEISRLESVINFSNPQHNAGCLAADLAEEQTEDPGSNLVASVESVQRPDIVQACAHDRQNKQEALSGETIDDDKEDGAACAGAAGAACAAGAAACAAGGGGGAAAGVSGGGAAAAEDPATHLLMKDLEAYDRSKNVTCGICMETVYEKSDPRSRTFGLLPNCNHSYCLQCIMTWRKTKDLGPDIVKSCPQCRMRSAFYVPHKYWAEGQEKTRVIAAFKDKFSKKNCSYYSRSRWCPFKTDCLYRHDKESRHGSFQFPMDDDDYDGLLNLFLTMTLLYEDDDEDDDTVYDFPYYLPEEFGF